VNQFAARLGRSLKSKEWRLELPMESRSTSLATQLHLIAQDLRPEHMFLDIGCSCLRVARHLIEYLALGHFAGSISFSHHSMLVTHRNCRKTNVESAPISD